MFSINDYQIKISVNLDNGLYLFDNESAIGKSRLCSLLKKYRTYGEPVLSYPYDDFKIHLDIETIMCSSDIKLVVLDRYDMYRGYALEFLERYSERSIVLIDCKHNFRTSLDYDWCYVAMTANSIEVS